VIHCWKALFDTDASCLEDNETAEGEVAHQRTTNDARRIVHSVDQCCDIQHHSVIKPSRQAVLCPPQSTPIHTICWLACLWSVSGGCIQTFHHHLQILSTAYNYLLSSSDYGTKRQRIKSSLLSGPHKGNKTTIQLQYKNFFLSCSCIALVRTPAIQCCNTSL